ncbi:MAG: galactose-1-phosphate uridylyltransferase, partial [Bacillales bacterium]
CLLCDMNEEEKRFGQRIVAENEHFICYLPYFTDYPYGVFIVSRAHKTAITDFNKAERKSLAEMLKNVTGAMDLIYDRLFPYMMVMHQRPVSSDVEDYYHFHIEFYPPLRDKDKIKYYASSEMGAWAATNPRSVEETAPVLREAYRRFLNRTEGEGER